MQQYWGIASPTLNFRARVADLRALESQTCALKPRDFELTFLGNALERLSRALDAVLIVGAVGREQPDDLIGAIGRHLTNRT